MSDPFKVAKDASEMPPLENCSSDDNNPHKDAWYVPHIIKSLEHVTAQLCRARDDTYHRARAEASSEVLMRVILSMHQQCLDQIREN